MTDDKLGHDKNEAVKISVLNVPEKKKKKRPVSGPALQSELIGPRGPSIGEF